MTEESRPAGFYWVHPVHDVDSEPNGWEQDWQPAHWDGEVWSMLGTEDWAVNNVGAPVAPRVMTPTDQEVEAVARAMIEHCEPHRDFALNPHYREQVVECKPVARAAIAALDQVRNTKS